MWEPGDVGAKPGGCSKDPAGSALGRLTAPPCPVWVQGLFWVSRHGSPSTPCFGGWRNGERVCGSAANTRGDVVGCLCWKRKRESTPNKFLLFRNTMGNLKNPIKYVCRSISHSGRRVELFYGAIL